MNKDPYFDLPAVNPWRHAMHTGAVASVIAHMSRVRDVPVRAIGVPLPRPGDAERVFMYYLMKGLGL